MWYYLNNQRTQSDKKAIISKVWGSSKSKIVNLFAKEETDDEVEDADD